jgi:hypothetical protein
MVRLGGLIKYCLLHTIDLKFPFRLPKYVLLGLVPTFLVFPALQSVPHVGVLVIEYVLLLELLLKKLKFAVEIMEGTAVELIETSKDEEAIIRILKSRQLWKPRRILFEIVN